MVFKPKLAFVTKQLGLIKKQDLYRTLRYGTINGAYTVVNGKKLLNLSSNDYLGIPPTKLQLQQLQSSSRLVSGNDPSFRILEKKLAKHKSQEECLIFPTGYMANLGSISAIVSKNDLILSDEFNHASIIDACKLTNAKTVVFKHNDIGDLEEKVKQKAKRKFIVSEGIFSMDGDFAKIAEITKIAERNNAITILDDAHGDFVVGKDGKGTADFFEVSKKIDIYVSSLSKALGSFGGYVVSQKNIIELCINRSKPFIYTSALPSTLVSYSIQRFDSNREKFRKKLQKNVQHVIHGLKAIGYQIESKTHIMPIIIGNEKEALDFGRYLYTKGIFAQPIRFPTVPRGQARIRLSVTAWLSKNQIEKAFRVFELAAKKFSLV